MPPEECVELRFPTASITSGRDAVRQDAASVGRSRKSPSRQSRPESARSETPEKRCSSGYLREQHQTRNGDGKHPHREREGTGCRRKFPVLLQGEHGQREQQIKAQDKTRGHDSHRTAHVCYEVAVGEEARG